jgi:AraC-like DNA-binding protein
MVSFVRNFWKYGKILFAIPLFAGSIYSESCIQFVSPKPGKILTSPNCTLSIESTCSDIQRIEVQARYFSLNSDIATIVSIGSRNRPPYEFVWDIAAVPNQLFAGVAFLAEATHRNGEVEDIRREGIFLAHQPVKYENKSIHYDYAGTKNLTGDTFVIQSSRSNLQIKSCVYWNEKDLTFIIDVEDPFFHSNMSKNALSEIGVEIMLDPLLSRKPYPNKDIIAFTIPLYGIPYNISYKPSFDENGSFKMVSSSTPCDFPYSVLKDDYKGYKIYFPIPKKMFGNVIPESLACNIKLKVLNENNQITDISWVKSGQYDINSPMLWNYLSRTPKPLIKSRLLILGGSFLCGLVLTFFLTLIIKVIKMPKVKKAIEKTEAEQNLFDNLKEAIDRQITYKNFTNDIVSRELHISSKKLNNLIKNLTGMSFQNYLAYSRIEIAKERLRSSYCNESTIADACGFKDESELDKYFLKFEHTTPAKYRQKQQVT